MLEYLLILCVLILMIGFGKVTERGRDPLEGKDRSSHRAGRQEDDCV